jgi:hypothetical protein
MIKRIISGGQTGAERAALDFAIKMDLHTVAGLQRAGWLRTDQYPPGTI